MPKTALLLFIRSEQDEIRHKRLVKFNDSSNQGVIRALNNRIVRTANKTDLPFFVVDSRQQVGTDFSERLQNAFGQIFKKGFDQVISVGNDIPNLTSTHILDANRGLQANDICFGRTQKQGVYLFGLKRETFEKLDFSAIKWQDSGLIPSIHQAVNQVNAEWTELEDQLHELNSAHDVKRFLKFTHNDSTDFLLQLLNELFRRPRHFFVYSASNCSNLETNLFLLRGPPQVR